VDDLVVDGKFVATIVDDEDTNAATAVVEAFGKPVQKIALVKHTQTLLDVAGLGHGNNTAVSTDVQNAVLLEDRTTHVLDNDRR